MTEASMIEPGYLIALLFLVGLGVLFTLHSRHYKRMERLAKEMYGIRDLKDELIAINKTLRENESERLLSLLEEIREACLRIERKVETPAVLKVPEGKTAEPVDLFTEIERRLRADGYSNIHLLADEAEPPDDPGAEYRLPLEAHRDGVAFKGHITIRAGRIVSERIKPAYEAFP
jgi:hypothetical protein